MPKKPPPKVDAPPPAPAPEEKPKRGRGRPEKAPKVLGRKAEVDELVAAYAPTAFEKLQELCDGAIRTKRVFEAAGVIFRKDVVREKDGSVYLDGKGKPVPVQVCVFPDLPPDQMVPVGEEWIILEPDEKALEYMLNRLMGRPAEVKPDDGDNEIDAARALAEAHGLKDKYRDPDEEAAPDAPGP